MSERAVGLIMVVGPALGIIATVIEAASDDVTAWNVVQVVLFTLVLVAGFGVMRGTPTAPSPPADRY
jgi:hypothetical protein